MLFLFSIDATLFVAPEPINGSRTVSPTYENSFISLYGISSENAAIPFSSQCSYILLAEFG